MSILYLYCVDREIDKEVCKSTVSEIEKCFDKLRGKGDDQTKEIKDYVESYIDVASDELKKYILRKFEKYAVAHDDNFGNARFVRNIFERAISAQAVRLTERADDIDLDSPSGADKLRLKELTKSDIDWAFKEM